MMFLHLTTFYFFSERTKLTSGGLFKLMIPIEWTIMATICLLAYAFTRLLSDTKNIPYVSIAGMGIFLAAYVIHRPHVLQDKKRSIAEHNHYYKLASGSDDDGSHCRSL